MKEFDSYIKAKYDISSLVDANPYDIIFFDIETTGFMPSDSMIYMIGLSTLQDDDIWHIRQFLAESLSEERELLDIFSRTISKYNILIS